MSHYVYFIQQQTKSPNAPVKIGYSSTPEKRLSRLQTGNPVKLKLCKEICFSSEDDARKVERTLHHLAGKKFKSLEGEWFVIYGSWKKLLTEAYKMCRISPH